MMIPSRVRPKATPAISLSVNPCCCLIRASCTGKTFPGNLLTDYAPTLRASQVNNCPKKRAVRIEFFYFRLATVYLSTSKYSLRLLVESTDPQTRERAVKLAEDLRRF